MLQSNYTKAACNHIIGNYGLLFKHDGIYHSNAHQVLDVQYQRYLTPNHTGYPQSTINESKSLHHP